LAIKKNGFARKQPIETDQSAKNQSVSVLIRGSISNDYPDQGVGHSTGKVAIPRLRRCAGFARNDTFVGMTGLPPWAIIQNAQGAP
jgi:hypothetical protein